MHKELVRIWWCRDMSDLIQSHPHPSKMSKSVFVWLEPISSPASLPWPSLPSLTSPAADSAPRMTRMIFALTKCYITLKKSQANWDYAMRKMHCGGLIDKTKMTNFATDASVVVCLTLMCSTSTLEEDEWHLHKKQRCPSHMAWGEKYFSRPFDLDHAFSGEGVSVDFREFFLGFLPSASLCPAVYYLCARKTLSKRLLSSSSLDRVTRSIWRSGVVITVILAHLLHRKMQQMQSIKFPLNYLDINQNVTHRDKCVYLSHFKPWRRTLGLWLMK